MRLNQWMREKDITDQKLADKLGISREYARLLWHGRRNPSPELVVKIAQVTAGQVDAADFTQTKENI